MSVTLEFLGRQQVLTELVAEINVELLKSTFSMYEVAEMEIDKFPLWVMFTELITEILQKISLEFVLVEEIIPFIHYRLESAATDGFSLLGHYLVEVLFPLVLRIGIYINAKRTQDNNPDKTTASCFSKDVFLMLRFYNRS